MEIDPSLVRSFETGEKIPKLQALTLRVPLAPHDHSLPHTGKQEGVRLTVHSQIRISDFLFKVAEVITKPLHSPQNYCPAEIAVSLSTPNSARAFFSLRTPLELLMQYSEMERGISTIRAIGPARSRQIDDNFCRQLFGADPE